MKQITMLLVLGIVVVALPVMAEPTVFALYPTSSDCLEALDEACADCEVDFQSGTCEELIQLIEAGESLVVLASNAECAAMVRKLLKVVVSPNPNVVRISVKRTDGWGVETVRTRAAMLVASIRAAN